MKHLSMLCILLISSLSIYSQEADWSRIHALKTDKGEINIEISGYEITILNMGKTPIYKAFESSIRRFGVNNITSEYTSSQIELENKAYEAELLLNSTHDIKANQTCYLIKQSNEEVTTIFMQTLGQKDVVLEEDFIKAYISGKLASYISDSQIPSSFMFVGREIQLNNNPCEWKGAHNIQCQGGQISWSEYPAFESAMQDINTRILLNNKDNLTVLIEEDIDILFEDIPSLAHRIVYKSNTQASILIVYYVVQEVRGQYVSCILSNYGSSENDYRLAPLLRQVMSIPKLPEWASEEPLIYYEPLSWEDEEDGDDAEFKIPTVEIRAGSLIPLGKQSKVYKAAPSINMFIGFPIKPRMAIDLGFQLAFPVKKKYFEFHYDRLIYDVKADMLVGVGLRWRYEQEVARNVYFTNYLGLGLAALQTDLEKDDWDDETDKYHSAETLWLFGGVSLRYKKVGCFLEYNYTPYSTSNKIKKNFGNSAINIGAMVAF